MNEIELGMIAGALLSLLFSLFPKVKEWYASKEQDTKSLVMIAALAIVSVIIFAGSCYDLGLPYQVTCDKQGIVGLVMIFLAALGANQPTYLITRYLGKKKSDPAQE